MNPELNYIVKPKERKVICIGYGCSLDACEKIKNMLASIKGISEDEAEIFSMIDSALMNCEYKGIANCDPEDEFSIEEGKRVARRKMLKNYTNAKVRAMERFLYTLKQCYDSIIKEERYYQFKVDVAKGDLDPDSDEEVDEWLAGKDYTMLF